MEVREEEQKETEARQNEENQRYERYFEGYLHLQLTISILIACLLLRRLKKVVMYYDVWELPPSNATRLLFMEQVLLPKIEYEQLITSSQLRGLEFEHITKMDLSLALGECYELEIEVKGEVGHAAFKESERVIKVRASEIS